MLALGSRAYLAEPTGRLRAHGLLLELGPGELSLTHLEAARLAASAGLALNDDQLTRLLTRIEGWPAALSLAATALKDAHDVDRAIAAFDGDDRIVADYLECDLLARLTRSERTLLRRCSVLSCLSGPACDAVLEVHGSGATLRSLLRMGLPLIPLDRCDNAFRQHPLLASMLRAELMRAEPELAPALQRRASLFYAQAGEPDAAIQHAIACRDKEIAGRMLWSIAPEILAEGHGARLGSSLDQLRESELASHPGLALAAAAHHLAGDRRRRAQGWSEAADRLLAAEPGEWSGAAALVRACLAHEGVARLEADAQHACDRMPLDGAGHCLALYLSGVAHQLGGGRTAARERLGDALSRSADAYPVLNGLVHAQLALLAFDATDWTEADAHANAAYAALAARPSPDAAHALGLAVFAVAAAQRADVAQARHDAAHAGRLLATLTDATPWLLAETHVWLARAQIRLSDGPTARMHLARAARFAGQVKDSSVLAEWIHEGWERADAFACSVTGDGPTLTNAELRVLRMLPSHMTFREISERLHVSTNTVKTQALSVYRKLDVSCRSEAVDRGRLAGVIDD